MKHSLIYKQAQENLLAEAGSVFAKNEDLFEQYADLLLWWNDRINLVSRNVSRETTIDHIKHSLMLASLDEVSWGRVVDAGTGGGLPGVPLAIALPGSRVVLNDIVQKKVIAVKNIVQQLALKNVATIAEPIEKVPIQEGDVIVSKHAFKIGDLMKYVDGKGWSEIILLKGEKDVEKEVKGVEKPLKVEVINLEGLDNSFYNGKAIVRIKKHYNEEFRA